ncbi:hypothetical protein [Paenibacillus sp. CCS19]|uniref:hypothetical protein n=1 Tax=Paenibacillus sp. CCS19 TaxID=3158387 RepID=UPI003312FECC
MVVFWPGHDCLHHCADALDGKCTPYRRRTALSRLSGILMAAILRIYIHRHLLSISGQASRREDCARLYCRDLAASRSGKHAVLETST